MVQGACLNAGTLQSVNGEAKTAIPLQMKNVQYILKPLVDDFTFGDGVLSKHRTMQIRFCSTITLS